MAKKALPKALKQYQFKKKGAGKKVAPAPKKKKMGK